MKIHTHVDEAEVSGATADGEFKIRSSAKAFAILSSGLYSDKFRAIVRELGCNAYDSHIEAGKKEVPFVVHLPNRIEPYFSVKDEGVGLDHEEVMNIYTVYFESTKNQTNDLIGGLGLGSKSPFSYTQNFTVVATKDHTRRVYGCYVNDNGVPSVAQLGEEVQTDDPNGVEVKFSVEEEDYAKFDTAVREVFQWFDVKPKIVGRSIEIPTIEYQDEVTEGVRIIKSGTAAAGRALAIMGHVAYPLSPPASLMPDGLAELLQIPFVVDFDIGELDFVPSREHLQYIPATMTAIIKRFETIAEKYKEFCRNKIRSQHTPWDKVEVANELAKQGIFEPTVKEVMTETNKLSSVTYRQKAGKWGIEIPLTDFMLTTDEDGNTTQPLCRMTTLETRHPHRRRFNALVQLERTRDLDHVIIYPGCKVAVYIDDIARGGLSRVRAAVTKNNTPGHQLGVNGVVVVFSTADEEIVEKIESMFRGHTVTRTSDLNRVSTNYTSRSKGTRLRGDSIDYLMLDRSYTNNDNYVWDTRTGRPSENVSEETPTMFYVILKNKTVMHKEVPLEKESWQRFVELISAAGIVPNPQRCIIGVRKNHVDVLDENCVDLFDHIRNELRKVSRSRIEASVKWRSARQANLFDERDELPKLRKILPADQRINAFLKKAERNIKRNTIGELNPHVLRDLFIWMEGPKSKNVPDVFRAQDAGNALWKEVADHYPMMKHVSRFGRVRNTYVNDLANYILMVDAFKQQQDTQTQQTVEAA